MERQYPDQYSKPLAKLLKAISFGTPNVVGSSADPQIMYSADYDLIENVILRRGSSKKFQEKVRKIQKVAKIVDIKCGEISQWNLLKKPYVENGKVKKYKQEDELKHLSALWQNKIITHDEYMSASELLTPNLDAVAFLEARKELRFGLLKWTVSEVLQGYKELRDESIYYLEDAFRSKGITKLDLIAWATDKYIEISNIVVWVNSKGKPYAYIPALKKALKENILEYEADENYVKLAKRMYSLAKQYKDTSIVEALKSILNSPIGKLYMVTADMEVLEEFPNAVTQSRKRKQLDSFKNFFAKLYFPELNNATPSNTKLSYLKEILQEEMKKALKKANLLPIPRDYMI
jgi:hypothetical protein